MLIEKLNSDESMRGRLGTEARPTGTAPVMATPLAAIALVGGAKAVAAIGAAVAGAAYVAAGGPRR